MTWPPQSPDLNPIENLWSIIKYRLSRKQLSNKEDLIVNFISEWNSMLGDEICQNLIKSMPKRVEKVIQNKGGPIDY